MNTMRRLLILFFTTVVLPAIGCGSQDELVVTADVDAGQNQTVDASVMPRNIIILSGDGMGPQHVKAARIFKGGKLRLDALRGPVLYSTTEFIPLPDNEDRTTTDSAAAMSAIATGKRVYIKALSITPAGKPLKTILELFMAQGKAAGLATNSTVLDASPMAWAAHNSNRYHYDEIAREVLKKTKPDLLMGGWMPDFEDDDAKLSRLAESNGYRIIAAKRQLEALPTLTKTKVLGLFRVDSPKSVWPEWKLGLTPAALRDSSSQEPSLKEMMKYALKYLSQNPRGFFLFLEDELPDTIGEHSDDDPELAVRIIAPEVAALDEALGAALDWVEKNSNLQETLIVLCADHETGGYTLHGDDLSRATFETNSHTTRKVALYAAGPGSEYIDSIKKITDLHLLLAGQLTASDAQ